MYIIDKNTGELTAVIFDSLKMVGTSLEVALPTTQLDGQLHVEDDYDALITADTTLHELVEGGMYKYSLMTNDGDPIGDNLDLELLLSTPSDRHVHVGVETTAAGDSEFRITENVTIVDEGSGMQAYNLNRLFPDTGITTSGYSQPTTVGGTTIFETYIPGGIKNSAVGSELHSDFILTTSEDYVVKLTNRSGNNAAMAIVVKFYEHDE